RGKRDGISHLAVFKRKNPPNSGSLKKYVAVLRILYRPSDTVTFIFSGLRLICPVPHCFSQSGCWRAFLSGCQSLGCCPVLETVLRFLPLSYFCGLFFLSV